MFAQVIVGLDDRAAGSGERGGAAVRPENRCCRRVSEKGLTLTPVVTVGFLTVTNGHVR
jgi:hypothetical protein